MQVEVRVFDDPVLKQVCDTIPAGTDMSELIQDMNDTLDGYPLGVGLAASQIGVTKRLILVKNRKVMINPKITWVSPNTETMREGCLSYPGIYVDIERPLEIAVEYFTEEWEKKTDKYKEFLARIICHEVDHTLGICRVGDKSNVGTTPKREEKKR